MDRLSEAGAIAGSKEPRTCRADVASPPRTAPPLLRGARAAAGALVALALGFASLLHAAETTVSQFAAGATWSLHGETSRARASEYQLMAEQSREAVQIAQIEAEAQIAAMRQDAAAQVDEFRATYPTRLQFPYALDDKAARWPFLVQGMWHDGQFTYVRSTAQETPALYENRDGEPSLIPYDLQQDGLFIVRRLVGSGWLQIGRDRAGWKIDLDDLD